jgi:2-aminoethylphosphonate-pyruvate transaminase
MIEKKMLFSPGPVLTSERVKLSLYHPDMCHRRPVFEQVFRRVRENILRVFQANEDYTAVVVSGSGTAANETGLCSVIKESDEVLLIKNGEFGERLHDILNCYRLSSHVLEYPWGTAPNLSDIACLLSENEGIRWVCMVYHETSTGMRNPVYQVGKLVKKYKRKLYVDSISAVGGEDINVVRENIDVCSGVPNKALGGLPGVSFLVAKRSSIPSFEDISRRNIYLNLQTHIAIADLSEQTPNTPSVTMIVALDEALQELFDEGLENRIKRYQECSRIIRAGVKKLNLQTLITENMNSNTVTSVFLPQSIKLEEFIDEMDSQGYVVYPGKRHLFQKNLFQIANMGQIQPQDCIEFLQVLESTLNRLVEIDDIMAMGTQG